MKGARSKPKHDQSNLDINARIDRHQVHVRAGLSAPLNEDPDALIFDSRIRLVIVGTVLSPKLFVNRIIEIYSYETKDLLKASEVRARGSDGTLTYKKVGKALVPVYNLPDGIGQIHCPTAKEKALRCNSMNFDSVSICRLSCLLASHKNTFLELGLKKVGRGWWWITSLAIANFNELTDFADEEAPKTETV